MAYKDPEVAKAKKHEFYLKNKEIWSYENVKDNIKKYQSSERGKIAGRRNSRKYYWENKLERSAYHKEWRKRNKPAFPKIEIEKFVAECERVYGRLDDTGDLRDCASMFLFGSLNSIHDYEELWKRTLYDKDKIEKWVGNLKRFGIWIDGKLNADLDFEKIDLSFFTELILCCMTANGDVARRWVMGEAYYGLPEWGEKEWGKTRIGGSNYTKPKKKRR